MNKLKSYFIAAALACAFYLGTAQVSFGQSLDLVTNGDFTEMSLPSGGQIGYNNLTLTGWTTTGYNFVFPNGNPGDVNVTGASGSLSLWGPANGSANGLVLPPGGGNVVANDGAYEVAALSQSISGLAVGKTYAVSFEWAGAQQKGFDGDTTESWTVSLGSQSQNTITLNNSDKGFTGWMEQTFDFTATGTTETLSFLANGTPTGEPPFSLLADVTMTEVPEPKVSAAGMILFGMMIMIGSRVWRRHQGKSLPNT